MRLSHPLDDLRAYRRALGQFATGVTVVTAQTPAGRVGNTVNSFASVSLDPPLVLWSLSKTSRSLSGFKQVAGFAVNVLGADQICVSQKFSSAQVDKFDSVACSTGANGSPVIDDAIAVFECDTETIHDCGDHLIIVGRVSRYSHREGKPLLYVQGCYGASDVHPALKRGAGGEFLHEAGNNEKSIAMLLFRAYHALSNGFEAHRRAVGITAPQARVVTTLGNKSPKDPEAIVWDTYLPTTDALDAISELTNRGLVQKLADGGLSLSEQGTALWQTLRARLKAFESQHTSEFSELQVQAAQKVLTSLWANCTESVTSNGNENARA